MDNAVAAAQKAFDETWRHTSVTERANMLLRIAQITEDNIEHLALVDTVDNGKPIRETLAADMPLVVDHFRYFASVIRAQEGGISELDEDTVSIQLHEPLGVVGQIIPWNFPLLMAAWKLAPALAAGNCVVLKPAEQTPVSIMEWIDLVKAEIPAGVLNVVHGFGPEAGKPLAQHDGDQKDRVHRRDHDRPPHHAVCEREHHPDHARAGREVAERVFRVRHGRGRRLF